MTGDVTAWGAGVMPGEGTNLAAEALVPFYVQATNRILIGRSTLTSLRGTMDTKIGGVVRYSQPTILLYLDRAVASCSVSTAHVWHSHK